MPLVGIIEFNLQGTCKYFIGRYALVLPALSDARLIYGTKMTQYMADKMENLCGPCAGMGGQMGAGCR